MLRAYWDESGSADDEHRRYMGIAGIIASRASWDRIEAGWTRALRDFDAPYLHMREFAHWRGAFADRARWTEVRRRVFLGSLLRAVAAGQPRLHGAVVDLQAWRALDAKYQRAFRSPWLVCLQECARLAAVYGHVDKETVEMCFAHHPEFSAEAPKLWAVLSKSNYPGFSQLGELTMADMRDVPALQIADLVAYEVIKFGSDSESTPQRGLRVPLQALMSIDPGMFVVTIDDDYFRWQCEGVEALERTTEKGGHGTSNSTV